jgi:hypothetical protein
VPVDNIVVNANSQQGPQLRALQSQIYAARNLAKQIKEQMDQQTDATDWTKIEAQFGLAAGNGTTVYNLVAALVGTSGLEAFNVATFCQRIN